MYQLKKAIQLLNISFTVLVDMRNMQTPGHLLKDLHIKAQKVVVDAGGVRSAEVIPGRISLELELEDYATDSLLIRKAFKDIKSTLYLSGKPSRTLNLPRYG